MIFYGKKQKSFQQFSSAYHDDKLKFILTKSEFKHNNQNNETILILLAHYMLSTKIPFTTW
jgi:hypothetical protein